MKAPVRSPRQTDAVIVDLSASLRAVVVKRSGATTFLRGHEAFHINDAEASKLDAVRASLGRERDIDS